MSGPKVVRIVTEEEKIAICNSQLAILSSSSNALISWLEKEGLNTEQIEDSLNNKIIKYQSYAIPENYRALPAKVAKEVDFISAEKERYKKVIIQQKISEISRRRNLSESIRTLILLHEQSNINTDLKFPTYSKIIKMNDKDVTQLEEKTAAAFQNLAHSRHRASSVAELTGEQKALIDRLKSAEDFNLLGTLKKQNKFNGQEEGQKCRLEALLAEIETLTCETDQKEAFIRRVESIYDEVSEKKKSVLIDSLVIELAEFVRRSIQIRDLKQKLSLVKAQINTLGNEEIQALSLQIDKAIVSSNIKILARVEKHCQEVIQSFIQKRASDSGRKALIKGLRSLGYAVNEEMQTALVENGQLVVRKNSYAEYGVEVRGVANTKNLQVRLVSPLPESQRRKQDDDEAENKWCDDFSELRKKLSKDGVEISFEMAMKPGQSLVKHSSILETIVANDSSRKASSVNNYKSI